MVLTVLTKIKLFRMSRHVDWSVHNQFWMNSAFVFGVSSQRLKMKALCFYIMLATLCLLTCCNIPEDLCLHEVLSWTIKYFHYFRQVCR